MFSNPAMFSLLPQTSLDSLIANNGQDGIEVAYDVGFNDPNYFSRTFLQEFGHSPSAARK